MTLAHPPGRSSPSASPGRGRCPRGRLTSGAYPTPSAGVHVGRGARFTPRRSLTPASCGSPARPVKQARATRQPARAHGGMRRQPARGRRPDASARRRHRRRPALHAPPRRAARTAFGAEHRGRDRASQRRLAEVLRKWNTCALGLGFKHHAQVGGQLDRNRVASDARALAHRHSHHVGLRAQTRVCWWATTSLPRAAAGSSRMCRCWFVVGGEPALARLYAAKYGEKE